MKNLSILYLKQARFFITVRKNYRDVAYHNWTHGFHVANSTYAILKSCGDTFRPLEMLAMFIGALCHDLDHRGFNNKFMIDIGSPLAAIYSTSTMEHHHFNMTMSILQQEGNNIFRYIIKKKKSSIYLGLNQEARFGGVQAGAGQHEALHSCHRPRPLLPKQSEAVTTTGKCSVNKY